MSNEISDTDYIVRYCRPNTIIRNQISSPAFEIRNNEEYISVNWISSKIDVNVGLEQIKMILEQKKFRVRQNGRFVILNTGIIKSAIYELTGIKISIHHKRTFDDPTHASISPIGTNNRQKLMDHIGIALYDFVQKHPETIYPVFGDKKA